MLIRELKKGERVVITHGGEEMTISLAIDKGRSGVRLAIDAPRSYEIGRPRINDSWGNR